MGRVINFAINEKKRRKISQSNNNNIDSFPLFFSQVSHYYCREFISSHAHWSQSEKHTHNQRKNTAAEGKMVQIATVIGYTVGLYVNAL